MIKAYRFPESEIAWPWLLIAIGVTISLLTIKQWVFANYGFIVYLLVANLIIFTFAQFRPRSKPASSTITN